MSKSELRGTVPGWYEMHFDSPLDMLDVKASPSNLSNSESTKRMGGDAWSKCPDYDAFRTLIRTGAAPWVKSVMAKADQLTVAQPILQSLITVNKRARAVADSGDELDFDAWRRNDVDRAWSTTKRVQREEKRNRACCLFVNLTAHAGVHADSMEWRSAAIIKIVQTLSTASWATEIVIGCTSLSTFADASDKLGITFTAKRSTMPLSIERLVLQTSAAWFRYATFEAMTSNDQDLPLCSTYGCPAYSMIPPYVARMFGRGYKIVQIPGTALSKSNAQEAINSTLREVQS